MSMINVPGDDIITFTDVTENSFTEITYYYEEDGTGPTSKFRGKYRKVTKYSFEIEDASTFFILNRFPKDKIPDYVLIDFLRDGYYKDGSFRFKVDLKVLSEKIELNPDYDLEYFQKEYESIGKDIAKIKKETGLNVW